MAYSLPQTFAVPAAQADKGHNGRTLRHMYRKKVAQRKKLSDASYDDTEMGIDICLVFFNTTYP